MRKTIALVIASTAIGAALGLPAFSAIRDPAADQSRPVIAFPSDRAEAMPLLLASDDEDDDDHGWRESSGRGHDDEDEDDDDCDDDDDDDDVCRGAAGNPAPAGTVAPPQNGLFGNGAPPRVQMN
jgi:hypothetical protein